MFRVTTIQTYSSSGSGAFAGPRPGFFSRAINALTFLALIVLGGVAAVALLILGLVVAGVALIGWVLARLYYGVRRLLVGAQAPNGVFDGRRNVRVVERGADEVVDQAP